MELRPECGRCHRALTDQDRAFVCSFDCTWCPSCFRLLHGVCPNCGGELLLRPRPRPSGSPAAIPPNRSPSRGTVSIRRATVEDLDRVAPLFDAYRQFYSQPANLPESRAFLAGRLENKESVVLVAEVQGHTVGFVQLYPSFSSISVGPIFVLNDLYVDPSARRGGVGARLLESARLLAEASGAHYLELSTAIDNPAQRLYEANGWALDSEFLHYELRVRPGPTAHG
jgi:GNAT superfamily N-acetyltransferase